MMMAAAQAGIRDDVAGGSTNSDASPRITFRAPVTVASAQIRNPLGKHWWGAPKLERDELSEFEQWHTQVQDT